MASRTATSAPASTAVLVALIVGVVALVCLSPLVPGEAGYQAGERAPRTLEAARSAQFESESLTEVARKQAADAVVPVRLAPNPAIKTLQLERLARTFELVRAVRQRELAAPQALAELANTAGPDVLSVAGRSALLTLERKNFEELQLRAEKALAEILDKGVARPAAAGTPARGRPDPLVPEIVSEYLKLPANSQGSVAEVTALRDVLNVFVAPNIELDAAATDTARNEARANVSAEIVTFTRGQVVISEGQVITEADIETLRATGLLSDRLDIFGLGAASLIALGFAVLVGASLYLSPPLAPPIQRRALLVSGMIAVALVAVRVAAPLLLPDTDGRLFMFALPIAAAPMVVAAFSNAGFGAVVAGGMALAAAFIAATVPDIAGATFAGSLQSLELATVYAATGVAGAFAVHRIDRMGRFALAAGAVAIAGAAALLVFWMLDINRDPEQLGWIALAGGSAGLLSTVIAAGVFVVMSGILGIPTRLHLMELADSGHPLQRRLRDEAPGTYHHSMMVGALAERAADRIGADVLLAKVGAYYHDTGKLSAPAFYIENMLDGGTSPHEAISATESAEIIRNHVVSGIQIGRRYRLPPAVRAFIPEHHGTRLVTYFYRKAAEAGAAPDPEVFRYTGPRPQSRESAIVMLADSCEALARARQHSGDAIDSIVDGVVAERLAEGQLDECDITMRELQEVARSFKATLRAVYHPRIEYPPALPDEVAALVGDRG